MEDTSTQGLEAGGATEAEGPTGGQGGEVMSAPGGGIRKGEAAMNFTSCKPSSQRPSNISSQFLTPQNVSNLQPSDSLIQARPHPTLPQQPHPSQTQQHLSSLQWQQRQEKPQPYPQRSIDPMTLQFQNQLQIRQEFATQTPRQAGEQLQFVNQSRQADTSSRQSYLNLFSESQEAIQSLQLQLQYYQNQQEFAAQTPTQVGEQSQLANQSIQHREPDISLYQMFSSPESMQNILSDRGKLTQLLEPNPVLPEMLKDDLGSYY